MPAETFDPSSKLPDNLHVEAIKYAGLSELEHASDEAERIEIVARLILDVFQDYYARSRAIPRLAKRAFEQRAWQTSLELSQERLSTYSTSVTKLAPLLQFFCPEVQGKDAFWKEVERHYLSLIDGWYHADLAFAFVHSTRRMVYQDQWRPVAYSYDEAKEKRASPSSQVYREFPCGPEVSPVLVEEILSLPGFAEGYRDLVGDAERVAARISAALAGRGGATAEHTIQMIDAGFYRNRGAYVIGRILQGEGGYMPIAIALLNEGEGIYVDAVLLESDELQFIFSSTLANFHVTSAHYHELTAFLRAIMPKRPLGLHYSTIGFNHVGKVAVMQELEGELQRSGEVLETPVGFRGSVAIAFSAPSSSFVLKVIRDTPTESYKWDTFDGVEAVLRKYGRVHEINRTGSMLDNIIFHNVELPQDWFAADVLDDLLANAAGTVALQAGRVIFKNLIVQLKVMPLPVFLETASPEDAATAVANLGYCIKNNAAANIFNKDLDGRNYGVSKILKVYLFDYDALEPLTEVKIRTNTGRYDGEEDVPDWVFEDGVIFLPEEIEAGLRIDDRALRRHFRALHGDLMTTAYWEGLQAVLGEGRVPRISTYPEERRLSHADMA